MDEETEYVVQEQENGMRLDLFLAQKKQDASRSFLQRQIEQNEVLVNQKAAKKNTKLSCGDRVVVAKTEPKELNVVPQDIPLDILYEDEDIIVVNKPKHMVVHPAPGHENDTLVNALLYHCNGTLSGINGYMRPGIVHRIDRDTTGAIVACKNDTAHRCLAKQIKDHTIKRAYHAIVCGSLPKDSGTIESTIGRDPKDRKKMAMNVKNGKEAVTHFRVLDRLNGKYTYVECTLETGRTHQIRVHFSGIGYPVLGDSVYGGKCPYALTGQTLHAKTLGFIHPKSKEYMEFDATLPDYFTGLLNKLSGTSRENNK